MYMAIANSNFGSVSFSVQRDAGSDGSLTAEKLERPVALGSFSHGLMKKMNAQNRGWRGGNDGASKIARSPIHDQEAGSKFCRIPSGGERILTSFVSSAVTGERFRGWCLSSTRSFSKHEPRQRVRTRSILLDELCQNTHWQILLNSCFLCHACLLSFFPCF